MRGFGRYSVLNQEHARPAAQEAAAKERKDAAREITERRAERRDRDQPVRKVERPVALPSVPERFDLRPSRPMVADAWSLVVPNGPAPGERDTGYNFRRHIQYQQVRELRQSAVRQADAITKMEGAENNHVRRNKLIKESLDRRAVARDGRKTKSKDDGKSVEVGDD